MMTVRRFKILDTPWNLEEQSEMLTFPFVEWSWLVQYRVGYRHLRQELENLIRWVPFYEAGRFQAAILHLDLEPVEPSKNALARRRLYEELDAVIERTPKIVIVHGSRVETDDGGRARREIRELIGGHHAVVSSAAVAERLGTGHVIPPGIAADDWLDLPKEPRVVTNLARATGPDLLAVERLRAALEERDILMCRIGVDYVPNTWAEYRDFLGRSLLYFAPSTYAERSKIEAMSSACCVLSAGGDGPAAGGYVVPPEPCEAADLVEALISDPAAAVRAGREARAWVRRERDWNKYARDWLEYLGDVVGRSRAGGA